MVVPFFYIWSILLNFSSLKGKMPILTVLPNHFWNKKTGVQSSSRRAYHPPSANWTLIWASVHLFRHGPPGRLGNLLGLVPFNPVNLDACNVMASCFKIASSVYFCPTEGARPPACPAGPPLFWLPPVARVQRAARSPSLMGRKSMWLTWTTGCPARICSRCCITLSPDMAG